MEGMHILEERKNGNPMGIGYLDNDKGKDLLEHREKLECLCIHCGNVLEQQWQVTKFWANEWKATIEKLEERIKELEHNGRMCRNRIEELEQNRILEGE